MEGMHMGHIIMVSFTENFTAVPLSEKLVKRIAQILPVVKGLFEIYSFFAYFCAFCIF